MGWTPVQCLTWKAEDRDSVNVGHHNPHWASYGRNPLPMSTVPAVCAACNLKHRVGSSSAYGKFSRGTDHASHMPRQHIF